jgi:hypothetical protein
MVCNCAFTIYVGVMYEGRLQRCAYAKMKRVEKNFFIHLVAMQEMSNDYYLLY